VRPGPMGFHLECTGNNLLFFRPAVLKETRWLPLTLDFFENQFSIKAAMCILP